ncbi:MAG: SAM-dependent methyltransferase [Anaerolineales bacterium]|nr:SAM-dependent methyltransferase [Anaerolineales bacterium]
MMTSHPSHSVLSTLSATAHWTASIRARESARPDALFYDPFAAALGGDKGATWLAERTDDKVIAIVLRTRFFDDFLACLARETSVRQIVMLAAGLDTRAFRLHWPEGMRYFEVDQPEVIAYKEAILGSLEAHPTCARQVIAQDLTGPWQTALTDAGFVPGEPSVWLLEGFLFYLPNEYNRAILETVSQLACPGSWLGFDIINGEMLTHPLTKAWVAMQAASGAPWVGTLDNPRDYLAQLGWEVNLTQAGQPDANFGRWTLPVLPTEMPGVPHNWFVTGKKR